MARHQSHPLQGLPRAAALAALHCSVTCDAANSTILIQSASGGWRQQRTTSAHRPRALPTKDIFNESVKKNISRTGTPMGRRRRRKGRRRCRKGRRRCQGPRPRRRGRHRRMGRRHRRAPRRGRRRRHLSGTSALPAARETGKKRGLWRVLWGGSTRVWSRRRP